VVALIGHTRTATGLSVKAKLDTRRYPTGCVVTHAEMRALALHPHAFHGDWNSISIKGLSAEQIFELYCSAHPSRFAPPTERYAIRHSSARHNLAKIRRYRITATGGGNASTRYL